MITRRGFLWAAAGATALAQSKLDLSEFQPRSMLVTEEHPVLRARFPVIDVHTHVIGFPRRRMIAPDLLAQILRWMDELNIETMLNLTGGFGEDLRLAVAELQEKHKGRFLVATEPSYQRIREPGYPNWQADELKRARETGARGLKILKSLGLVLREQIKTGPLVKIDDPRFDQMWEAAGALKLRSSSTSRTPTPFSPPSTVSTNAGRSWQTIRTGRSMGRIFRPRPSCWPRATA